MQAYVPRLYENAPFILVMERELEIGFDLFSSSSNQ